MLVQTTATRASGVPVLHPAPLATGISERAATGVVQFVGTPRARERRLGLERSCIERANGL